MPTVQHVALSLVDANKDQPRQYFDEAGIDELAASIAARGLDTPITVRPVGGRFEIVSGERRFRAHQRLGWRVVAALVRDMTERERDTAALVENVQRRDLTPMEEARSYHRMLTVYGMSLAELARDVGKSEARLLQRTQLLDLQPGYQALVGSGQLPLGFSQELARLKGRFQDLGFQKLTTGDVRTVRHAQAVVDALFVQQEQPELFDAKETGAPDQADREAVARLERLIDTVGAMASAGFDRDGRITAAQKSPANRAAGAADKLVAIARSLHHLADTLRRSATQAEFALPRPAVGMNREER